LVLRSNSGWRACPEGVLAEAWKKKSDRVPQADIEGTLRHKETFEADSEALTHEGD